MRLIVTGGGTGGHLFPGIAVASGMIKRIPATRVLFIGTGRPIDQSVLVGQAFEQTTLQCSGLKGKGFSARLRSLLQLPGAVFEAGKLMKRFRPNLVFGVGGYVTGPVLLAAKMARIPICIHEQNSVPGLANRLTGKLADRVFISLPCFPAFPASKTVHTGNPVREEIVAEATGKSLARDGNPTILVLGGSQGAHRVNTLMVDAVCQMVQKGTAVRIIHQTGKTDEKLVRDGYGVLGEETEVAAFIEDMASVYSKADLVVSRAGATTLAELAVLGLPVLLIPFPYAADNHQELNAAYYVKGKGAKMYRESELSGEILADEILRLLHNRKELHTMAEGMRELGLPGATERIVDECLRLAGSV